MTAELVLLMMLGMGNGLIHALDADHILAVSSVAASDKPSRRGIFRTALMWALGHGASLLMVTIAALGLGWVIPEGLSQAAEIAVGVLLIAIGLSIFVQLRKSDIRLSHHHHDHLPPHTHLHNADHGNRADHKPVLVGVIHGIAGSAPLLAVLPSLIQSHFLIAGLYILLFSVCVGLAMCIFGGVLGTLVHYLGRRFTRGIKIFQSVLGVQAIGFGCYWIASAV